MTEDITVVCECDAKDEARSMGYRRYADMDAAMIIESWPVHYYQTWQLGQSHTANTAMPRRLWRSRTWDLSRTAGRGTYPGR